MGKQQLAPVKAARAWTRVEDYVLAMARLRTYRRRRLPRARTQPESPRFDLSTLPFLALLALLAVLSVAIAIAAWPGRPHPQAQHAEARQPGTAPASWFREAKREMR